VFASSIIRVIALMMEAASRSESLKSHQNLFISINMLDRALTCCKFGTPFERKSA
jgi:hypothetical protein